LRDQTPGTNNKTDLVCHPVSACSAFCNYASQNDKAALNGIPVFVNLDKREGESACRGFTHATIDQLKSKIATAAIKTVSFNAMRRAIPCGAVCWQKSALFQPQDLALARK
jgi:hypothetical protein